MRFIDRERKTEKASVKWEPHNDEMCSFPSVCCVCEASISVLSSLNAWMSIEFLRLAQFFISASSSTIDDVCVRDWFKRKQKVTYKKRGERRKFKTQKKETTFFFAALLTLFVLTKGREKTELKANKKLTLPSFWRRNLLFFLLPIFLRWYISTIIIITLKVEQRKRKRHNVSRAAERGDEKTVETKREKWNLQKETRRRQSKI